jgi:hypothetical protein
MLLYAFFYPILNSSRIGLKSKFPTENWYPSKWNDLNGFLIHYPLKRGYILDTNEFRVGTATKKI